VHQCKGYGDRAATGQRAVVAHEHHTLVAKVGRQCLLFLGPQPGTIAIVRGELAGVGDGELVGSRPPLRAETATPAMVCRNITLVSSGLASNTVLCTIHSPPDSFTHEACEGKGPCVRLSP
jgi:hypothetical protein